MDLQGLYGDYKPQGLVGGMVSGLNTGANLGQLFSNTRSTNQQTDARIQNQELDLAQKSVELDKGLMANDLTRAVQTPEILDQKSDNAYNKESWEKLDMKKKMELLPFEKAVQMFDAQDKANLEFTTSLSNALRSGTEEDLYQQLKPQLSWDQRKKIEDVLVMLKQNPQYRAKAVKETDELAWKMADTKNRGTLATQQERWLQLLKGSQSMSEASVRASRETPENKDIWDTKKIAARLREQHKDWSEALVMAEAVRLRKSQETGMSVDGKPIGVEGSKGIPSFAPSPTTQAPASGGWVKGPDGVMRKQ